MLTYGADFAVIGVVSLGYLAYGWRCCGRWTRARPFLCLCERRGCVASPLRVSVLCVPVVVGEAVWKVGWGVLYVGHA
jgi:hypothetical protein